MSNALTQIRSADAASRKEVELGIEVGRGSWHDTFAHSAYVYVGGLPLALTEGDLLAICSQMGEIVHVDLCRDEETGKSKGFGFVAYEDQRSTVLAVDNLSGAKVGGRTLNVQHVHSYRKKKEELGLRVDDAPDVAEGGSASASGRSSEDEGQECGAEGGQQQANTADALNTADAPNKAPVPSWRDLVARRDAQLKSVEEEKRKRKRDGGRQKRRRKDRDGR